MNNLQKIACVSLLTISGMSTSQAALVNLDFTRAGSTDFVSYVVDMPLYNDFTPMELVSANINGTVYDASNASFEIYNNEITGFSVYVNDPAAGGSPSPVSLLSYNGSFGLTYDGAVDIMYWSDTGIVRYTGTNFSFDTNSRPLLTDELNSDESLTMTSLSVSVVSAVPVPAAVWLFGSGMIGLFALARRREQG